ncbi:MAG: hypothetical protein NC186_00275 [Prevotella sp.]|nr:hypothetical protein [Prevotella sp.]MCM1475446.1 hypothetical protein [Muribaculaceae bacterium]
MNDVLNLTYEGVNTPTNFRRLPVSLRTSAAERKYAEAVAMYAATNLSIRQVAEKCGVTPRGLSAHIGRHHRELLLSRYGFNTDDKDSHTIKVKNPKGQSMLTHLKYKDAIEACSDIAYIEYNVSQIARIFNLSATGLTAQLKSHYSEIIPKREELRRRLGIADTTPRGARPQSEETYTEALQLYRDTDMTIVEIAERCRVSKGGFTQYLRFYHKGLMEKKSACQQTKNFKATANTMTSHKKTVKVDIQNCSSVELEQPHSIITNQNPNKIQNHKMHKCFVRDL